MSFQGITTYDYILAMKEENQAMELESLEDSDFYSSDDESTDSDSPQKPALVSRIICKDGKTPQVVHICRYNILSLLNAYSSIILMT